MARKAIFQNYVGCTMSLIFFIYFTFHVLLRMKYNMILVGCSWKNKILHGYTVLGELWKGSSCRLINFKLFYLSQKYPILIIITFKWKRRIKFLLEIKLNPLNFKKSVQYFKIEIHPHRTDSQKFVKYCFLIRQG